MPKPTRKKPTRSPQQPGVSPHETSLLQWIVSFLFWGQLLVAGALYGSVAMAPKLATFVELNDEYVTAQTELVQGRAFMFRADKCIQLATKIFRLNANRKPGALKELVFDLGDKRSLKFSLRPESKKEL